METDEKAAPGGKNPAPFPDNLPPADDWEIIDETQEAPRAEPRTPEECRRERMTNMKHLSTWLQHSSYPDDSSYTESVLGMQGALLSQAFALLMEQVMDDPSLETLNRDLPAVLRVQRQSQQTLAYLEKLRKTIKKQNEKEAKELKEYLHERDRRNF